MAEPFSRTLGRSALRAWLAERRIPDCDCGYAWVHSPNEAYARTGRIPDGEYPRDYPRWVRTTVDERCPYHGSRRAGSTPDTLEADRAQGLRGGQQ